MSIESIAKRFVPEVFIARIESVASHLLTDLQGMSRALRTKKSLLIGQAGLAGMYLLSVGCDGGPVQKSGLDLTSVPTRASSGNTLVIPTTVYLSKEEKVKIPTAIERPETPMKLVTTDLSVTFLPDGKMAINFCTDNKKGNVSTTVITSISEGPVDKDMPFSELGRIKMIAVKELGVHCFIDADRGIVDIKGLVPGYYVIGGTARNSAFEKEGIGVWEGEEVLRDYRIVPINIPTSVPTPVIN